MGEQVEYKAERYFYDLRQLASYCDMAHTQATTMCKANSAAFYGALQQLINSYIAEDLRYISITAKDAQNKKSPLHCINAHVYEHVNRKDIDALNLPPYMAFKPSLLPIAAQYCVEQILNDSHLAIQRKQNLRDSLNEPQIAEIISHDIALKTNFHQAVEKMKHHKIDMVIVPTGHFNNPDVALRYHIDAMNMSHH